MTFWEFGTKYFYGVELVNVLLEGRGELDESCWREVLYELASNFVSGELRQAMVAKLDVIPYLN